MLKNKTMKLTLKEKRLLRAKASESEKTTTLIETVANVVEETPKEKITPTEKRRRETVLKHEEAYAEWNGMPEFIQPNDEAFQSVKLHFKTLEDRQAFEKLVGQNMTDKTKTIWFPKYDRERPSNFLYINENDK